MAKGNEQHIPPETDTVVRFPPEHVARFLRLCNLGNNGATRSATHNCVPLVGELFVRITLCSSYVYVI